jgi:tetratricopeptide (TPR) repeat protein
MRYHYDNSAANPLNPNHPPKRVRGGDQSTDEMGHLWLQILPRGPGDRRLELEEALMRHRLEKYKDDYWAHLKLGSVMLARLNASGAEPVLEAATRIDPGKPEAHNLLGAALARLGRTREAAAQFEIALREQPDYQNARYNLANAQFKAGQLDEAIANFRAVVAAFPNDADAKERLAQALQARSRK